MRTIHRIMLAALFLPALAAAQSPCPTLDRSLEFGMYGTDVWQLQVYLISQGDLEAKWATGRFGPWTQDALSRWQCSHGIVCTGTPETTGLGRVGPKTKAAIMKECVVLAETPYHKSFAQ